MSIVHKAMITVSVAVTAVVFYLIGAHHSPSIGYYKRQLSYKTDEFLTSEKTKSQYITLKAIDDKIIVSCSDIVNLFDEQSLEIASGGETDKYKLLFLQDKAKILIEPLEQNLEEREAVLKKLGY